MILLLLFFIAGVLILAAFNLIPLPPLDEQRRIVAEIERGTGLPGVAEPPKRAQFGGGSAAGRPASLGTA
mgnify:CR=1 FL=1